jgi:hypothetical protein
MPEVTLSAEQVRSGTVVAVERVPVDIRKRLLDAPVFSVAVTFPTTDVEAMAEEQFTAFSDEFVRRFESPADVAYRSWLSDVRTKIRDTERELSDIGRQDVPWSRKEREMKAVVKQVNAHFEQMCGALTVSLRRLGQSAYDAALKASCKAAGTKVPRTRAKVTAECAMDEPVPVVGERRIEIVPRSMTPDREPGPIAVRTLPRLRP